MKRQSRGPRRVPGLRTKAAGRAADNGLGLSAGGGTAARRRHCPSCGVPRGTLPRAVPPTPAPRPDTHVQEPACLHGPDEDLKGILGPGRHDLPAAVHGHAGELGGPRGRESAEVPVPARRQASGWHGSQSPTPRVPRAPGVRLALSLSTLRASQQAHEPSVALSRPT